MRQSISVLGLALAAFLSSGALMAETYARVAAKVGNTIITAYDIEEALNFAAGTMTEEEKASSEGKKKLEDMRAKILDRMIQEKIVVQAALREGEGASGEKDSSSKAVARPNPYVPGDEELEEEVSKALEDTRARFRSAREFQDELARQHITEAAFKARLRERLRDNLIFTRRLKGKQKELQGSFNVTAQEAEGYYKAHPEEFATGEQVKLRQMVLATEEQAKKLLVKVKAGADFEALAKSQSLDEATRERGGSLGWVEKGHLQWPDLEKAIFAAKEGQVVGPVATKLGWHLVKIEGTKAEQQEVFEQVRNRVVNRLYSKRMEEKITAWVDELKQKTFVETNP
jgi:foldase protein PrsA